MQNLKTAAILLLAAPPGALAAQSSASVIVTAQVLDMHDTRANLAAAYDAAQSFAVNGSTDSGESRRDTTTATILTRSIASGSESRRRAAALTIIYW